MKSDMTSLRSRVALLTLAFTLNVATAGVRVPLEQVPAPAVQALKTRFAKAEIRFVDKENNGSFEFAMREGDRDFDVGVSAEGKIRGVKEEIKEEKLPAVVREGVQKKYPGAKIVEAEKLTKGEEAAAKVTYELLIKTEKGNLPIEVDATGKVIGEGE